MARTPPPSDPDQARSGIEKAIVGRTFRDYERFWVLRSALERGLEVISEASRHLGRELKSQHKDVRWKDIAGIGNILRHEYQRVDGQIIWNAVKEIYLRSRRHC